MVSRVIVFNCYILTMKSSLHYHKIVQNEYWVCRRMQRERNCHPHAFQGYPEEWFPSVSSTIGDRYPERSVFQIFIAITSGTSSSRCKYKPLITFPGPRFALV